MNCDGSRIVMFDCVCWFGVFGVISGFRCLVAIGGSESLVVVGEWG